MVTSSPAQETRESALVRLAAKAREDGIRLYRDRRDGRHYASSRSQPGRLHYVTGISCTCEGFFHHQRCSHLAALHLALGWISTTPEPTPAASSTCSDCHGSGTVPATIATGPAKWAYGNETCSVCHGTGTAVDTAA